MPNLVHHMLSGKQMLVFSFLELPHYKRVKICRELDLPMNSTASSSEKQFTGVFDAAWRSGKIIALWNAVAREDSNDLVEEVDNA